MSLDLDPWTGQLARSPLMTVRKGVGTYFYWSAGHYQHCQMCAAAARAPMHLSRGAVACARLCALGPNSCLLSQLVAAFSWRLPSTRSRPTRSWSTDRVRAGQLARFLTNPGPSHFRAALRLLAYIRDNQDQPLVFATNTERPLETFIDSSWGTRFSVSGCMVFYHGCLFHWFSKMQRSVSLSSAEAEFFGGMMAARDLVWIRDLLVDLGISLDGPSIIQSDSKSAIDMSHDPVAFKKTKHILRAAEFLRDLVAREVITLKHLPGRVMIADLLTKAPARVVFTELIHLVRTYYERGVACPSS